MSQNSARTDTKFLQCRISCNANNVKLPSIEAILEGIKDNSALQSNLKTYFTCVEKMLQDQANHNHLHRQTIIDLLAKNSRLQNLIDNMISHKPSIFTHPHPLIADSEHFSGGGDCLSSDNPDSIDKSDTAPSAANEDMTDDTALSSNIQRNIEVKHTAVPLQRCPKCNKFKHPAGFLTKPSNRGIWIE